MFAFINLLGNPNRTHRKPASVSANIQLQLQSLLSLLKDRKTHYIFCVKPNEFKKANIFELPLVQHQIRYTNLMPVVNMWRMGYCFHLSHVNFLNRYKILSPETWPFYRIGSVIEGIATIIRELPLPSAEFILGTTKVFMRSPRTVSFFQLILRSGFQNWGNGFQSRIFSTLAFISPILIAKTIKSILRIVKKMVKIH